MCCIDITINYNNKNNNCNNNIDLAKPKSRAPVLFILTTSSNQRLGVRSPPVIIVVCYGNHYCERLKFYRHNILTKSTVVLWILI